MVGDDEKWRQRGLERKGAGGFCEIAIPRIRVEGGGFH